LACLINVCKKYYSEYELRTISYNYNIQNILNSSRLLVILSELVMSGMQANILQSGEESQDNKTLQLSPRTFRVTENISPEVANREDPNNLLPISSYIAVNDSTWTTASPFAYQFLSDDQVLMATDGVIRTSLN